MHPPTDVDGYLHLANVPQAEQRWPGQSRSKAPREPPGCLTNNDSIHPALLPCRAGLQSLVNLVCSQVKEVQIIFHGVAVPKPISQAHDS